MKIGLISDTHGSARSFERVLDGPFADVELILHAGDVLHRGGAQDAVWSGYREGGLAERIRGLEIPLIIARGNCDSEGDEAILNTPVMSPYALVYVDAIKILVLHGNGKKEADLEMLLARFRLNLLVHGHSHIARIRAVGGSLIVNPGTPAIPNPSSPFKKTVAVLDTALRSVVVEDIATRERVLESLIGT